MFVRFSKYCLREKESVHVISYDGAPGCPRRKPLSWKTRMWIDRFLCTIVIVVMPVAPLRIVPHASFFFHGIVYFSLDFFIKEGSILFENIFLSDTRKLPKITRLIENFQIISSKNTVVSIPKTSLRFPTLWNRRRSGSVGGVCKISRAEFLPRSRLLPQNRSLSVGYWLALVSASYLFCTVWEPELLIICL